MTDAEILAVADEWAKEPGWCDFERNDFIGCVRALLARYGQPAQPAASAEPWKEIALDAIRRMRAGHVGCMDIIGQAESLLQAERAAPVAAQPSVPDRQALTFDQWWSAGGHKIVSAQADRRGWQGAAEAGYIAGLLSSAAHTPPADAQDNIIITENGGVQLNVSNPEVAGKLFTLIDQFRAARTPDQRPRGIPPYNPTGLTDKQMARLNENGRKAWGDPGVTKEK
ncbi:hypothetical protein PT7_P025 (plasmid) [Pusillimonas sp. T7-7]|uniref:hypothetical protein n=1 Tax=Pusillimonas sp. (strain T7-7) TaxID=1007105 RepID=UPI0002084A90|nr:hypothetical protein [Pusillimonas sp. T7-7]AEC22261.1 hypothetical protein PT7_P025 [Pusillimonas sp. T7-7]